MKWSKSIPGNFLWMFAWLCALPAAGAKPGCGPLFHALSGLPGADHRYDKWSASVHAVRLTLFSMGMGTKSKLPAALEKLGRSPTALNEFLAQTVARTYLAGGESGASPSLRAFRRAVDKAPGEALNQLARALTIEMLLNTDTFRGSLKKVSFSHIEKESHPLFNWGMVAMGAGMYVANGVMLPEHFDFWSRVVQNPEMIALSAATAIPLIASHLRRKPSTPVEKISEAQLAQNPLLATYLKNFSIHRVAEETEGGAPKSWLTPEYQAELLREAESAEGQQVQAAIVARKASLAKENSGNPEHEALMKAASDERAEDKQPLPDVPSRE